MDLNNVFVCDIETTGLLPDMKGVESDLHVLGVAYCVNGKWNVKTTNKKEDVKKVFENPNNTIVGHNFFLFDLPALEKIYKDIEIKATIIDSLFLSWYIQPNRLKEGKKHGLESYGEEYGVPKPEISSWTDLSYEEYEHRVTEDVRINTKVWLDQLRDLRELYDNDDEKIKSLIKFLMVKAKQYKNHQDFPLHLDKAQALKNKEELEEKENKRVSILKEVMPKIPVSVKRKKPKNIYKKDGTLSAAGKRWKKITEHYKVPLEYDEELEEIIKYEEPNPKSVKQVKDWLFSKGWEPKIFTDSILKSGEVNKVPQIKDKNKNLCSSVLALAEKEPAIKELEDLGVIQHRLGIVKGFLRDCDENENIVAGVAGLTNCVTADTVITTNRGALPICEVTKEDQVLTHRGIYKRVTDFINNGVKPVYRITTSKGKSIKCTSKHRFYIGNEEWVCAENIKIGQEIYGYGDKEIWKSVGDEENPNFISSWGRYCSRRGKPSYYRKRIHKDIREFCSYTKGGKSFDAQRARLVMEKFIGASNLHVLHKDGKSCNNNIVNLYYGTDKENHNDTQIHGTLVKSHKSRVNSKLKHSDIKDIKRRIKEGETNISIAKSYGVCNSLISQIKNNKRWSEEKNTDNRYIETFEKEEVVSIELLSSEPTFDISVEDCHSYIANGLVTHNTLRIRHKYLVNMPKPSAPYGEYIRSLIQPQEGYIMIGSDLSSLENVTRNNFILPYDPEYVAEMDDKYYDSHLDIGVTANMITKSEALFYKWWKELKKNPEIKPQDISEIPEDYSFIEETYKTKGEKQEFFEKIDKVRAQAKTVNYSALYGVGKVKLSKELKITQREAKNLLDAYWKRNKAVKKFSGDCEVKTVGKQMWVKNPINGYFYSLRSEKDIFSTVNQSCGDYIFTMWIYYLLLMGVNIQGGWHDECLTTCHPQEKENVIEKLQLAINKVNRAVGLKIPVGLDYNIGNNYSEVH